jgi:RNA-binding protein Musashi
MSSELIEPERLIFVGGLSVYTAEEAVRKHFESFCAVETVKIMIDKRTKRSKGYAFVTVEDGADIDWLLAQPHVISGRKVDCQRAAKAKEKKQWKEEQKKKRIFINGLPSDLTCEQLESHFGRFGKIRNSYVIRDFQTKTSKRYGFVEYEDESVASLVLQMQLTIEDQPLILTEYKDKFEQRKELQQQQLKKAEELPADQPAESAGPSDAVETAGAGAHKSKKSIRTKPESAELEGRHSRSSSDRQYQTSSTNGRPGNNDSFEIVINSKYEFISLTSKLNEDVSNYSFRFNNPQTKPDATWTSRSILRSPQIRIETSKEIVSSRVPQDAQNNYGSRLADASKNRPLFFEPLGSKNESVLGAGQPVFPKTMKLNKAVRREFNLWAC